MRFLGGLAVLIYALLLSGCNLPPSAYAQFIEDYNTCGLECLIDDIKQIEQ